MGYLYSQNGGLLCDFCGAAGAIKKRCPFGYCQPIAACAECRKTRAAEFGRAAHRANGCETAHLRYQAEESERATAIASGEYLLSAGLNADNHMVHAIFRNASGELGKLIPATIYAQRVNFSGCMTLRKFEMLAGAPFADAPAAFHS